MAIAATVYLGWLGPAGLQELGRQCSSRAAYAAAQLTSIPGVTLALPGRPFFKEFALRLPRSPGAVIDALVERGFLAGVPMAVSNEEVLLVAVTERRTRLEIDAFAAAMRETLGDL
jgi:glycine dehydrogenase subunit 1